MRLTEVKFNQTYNNGGKDLLAQNTGYMACFEEGHPIGYFWGYKTEGVMQNEADVQAYLDKNSRAMPQTLSRVPVSNQVT